MSRVKTTHGKKKKSKHCLTGKCNPYYWLFLPAACLGKVLEEGRRMFPVKCSHTISCQPHPSDPTACPGKAAPALCSFPLILSLLYQIPQDFLPLWNTWGNVATTAMRLIPASSAQALDVTLVPSCQHCLVFTVRAKHGLCSLIFSGYWHISHTQPHLTSVSFTLQPPPQKLTFNSLSITFWLLISLPHTFF